MALVVYFLSHTQLDTTFGGQERGARPASVHPAFLSVGIEPSSLHRWQSMDVRASNISGFLLNDFIILYIHKEPKLLVNAVDDVQEGNNLVQCVDEGSRFSSCLKKLHEIKALSSLPPAAPPGLSPEALIHQLSNIEEDLWPL